ncbi:MAG: glycine-rich protein, partial [Verrucomicrobiota bacterium]
MNGAASALSVTATGVGLSYQWCSNSSASNSGGSTIAGANSASYTPLTTAAGIKYYYCIVSGTCSPVATSNVSGAITINPASVGGTVSGSAAVCTGTNSTTFTLSGHTGSITRWESSTASNFTVGLTTIVNTTTSLTVTNLSATTYYRAVVTSGVCSLAYSSTGTVTVNALPVLAAITGTLTVCQNATTSLTNSTAGGSWSSASTSVATIDASTGLVSALTGGSSVISYSYTNGNGCANSVTATVAVGALPSAPSPVTASLSTICTGSSSNLNATSAGNNINWYAGATGGTSLGTSASAANYSVTPGSTTTYYAESVTSSAASQTFNYTGGMQTLVVPAGVTSIAIDAYGAQGSNNGAVGGLGGRVQGTLAVTPGQTINIYVGGQGGYNGGGAPGAGGSWPGVYGGGATDLRVGGTALANRVLVAGGGGGGGSTGASWTAYAGGAGGGTTGGGGAGCCGTFAGGGTQSGGGIAGIGCGCNYNGTAGGLGYGGTGSLPCNNYGTGSGGGGGYYGGGGGATCGSGDSGGGGSSYIGGVTGSATTSGSKSGNGQVNISWTSNSCPSSSRTPVTVTVSPTSVGGSVAGSTTVCSGTNSTTLTLSGNTGSVTKWQSCTSVGFASGVTDIANTTSSLTATNLTSTTYYRAVVTSGACASANSSNGTVTVSPASAGGTISGATTVCSGTSSTTLTLSSYTGTIQWQNSTNNVNFINITGATSTTYAATNLTATTYYRAAVTSGACAVAYSPAVTMTVSPVSSGGTVSGSAAVCSGTNSTTFTLSGYTGSITRWESSTASNFTVGLTTIANTTTSLTATNLSTTTYYRAVITSGVCSLAYSSAGTVTVNALPVLAAITGTLAVCQNATSTLGNSTAGGTWSSATTAVATVEASSGVVSGLTSGTSVVTYSFTNGNGCANSVTATVAVGALPSAPTPVIASLSTICTGSSSNLNATSAGNNINWYAAATGGTSLGTNASAVNYSVSPGSTTIYYAESQSVTSQTFNYSGSIQNFTVPTGVISLDITAKGAQGGSNGGTGGSGAVMTGTFVVTPGQVLSILVGQQPTVAGTFAGGGGGTFVALGASYTTATPMIVAGGGGGAVSGTGGPASTGTSGNGPAAGTNGYGASSTSCGGGGGGFYSSGGADQFYGAPGGSGFRQGGAGGTWSSYQPGGFGGGAAPNYNGSCNMQGGAGGGYSGGSGLNSGVVQTVGYGGGSYNGGTNQTNSVSQTGNGQVLITWSGSGIACPSATRTPVTVTVSPTSVGGIVAGSTTVCSGTNSTTLTLSGNTGSVTKWQSCAASGFASGVSDIANTTTSLTATNLTTTTYYRAVVTSGSCASANSANATVTVSTISVGGTISGATTVCTGTNSTTLTLGGYAGTIQWQNSTDNVNFINVTGATSTTYVATNLTATTYYRAAVSNGSCTTAYSPAVTMTVSPVSSGGSVSGSAAVCSGTNSTTLTLSGYTGSIARWESSTASNFTVGLTTIANTTTSLTANNLSTTTYYRAVITSGVCSLAYSSVATIAVSPASVGGSIAGSTTVSAGTNNTNLVLSGYTGNIQWQSSTDNVTFANISSATSPVFTATNLTATTYYRAILTSGVCPASTSSFATMTVNAASVAGTISGAAPVCAGTNNTSLSLTGNTGTIQWQSSANNSIFSNIAGATNTTYTASNLSATTYYRVIVTSGISTPATSSSVIVTVNALPVLASITGVLNV